MASLLQAIKQAAIDAVRASDPANLIFAKVTKTTPLTVQVDQKLILTAPSVVSLVGLDLSTGDSVAILRAQGGQKFLILGKVVE